MRGMPDAELDDLAATVAVARLVLGPKVRIQAPPNLIGDEYRLLLRGRDRRLGRRLAADPGPRQPRAAVAADRRAGRADRRRRLHAARAADDLPAVRARRAVARPAGHPARRRAGRPGDGPGPATAPRRRGCRGRSRTAAGSEAGRTDLHTAIDTRAARRTGAPTSTASTATGTRSGRRRGGRASAPGRRLDADVAAALAPGRARPGRALRRRRAGAARRRRGRARRRRPPGRRRSAATSVGDDVTYVVNRNINFTNVCYTGCRFCAFAQRRTDADAYTLSLDQVGDRAEEAWEVGATEVCMQGGIHPDLPGTAYFDIAAEVRRRCPDMHVHAFSPDGGRQRGGPHRAVDPRLADPRARRPGSTRSPAPPRRSSTTTCAGC